jgi:hypothetical protein
MPLDYREEVLAHAIGSQLNPVHEKIKGFDYHVMQRLPFTVGKLVTSSLPMDKTIQIAKGLTGVMPWVDQRDSFAGQPGLLSGLRAKVLGYSDPGVKAQGLRILQELQGLSPADQQLALAVIKNPTDANVLAAGSTQAGPVAQEILGQAKVEDGHYALTGVQGGPPRRIARRHRSRRSARSRSARSERESSARSPWRRRTRPAPT